MSCSTCKEVIDPSLEPATLDYSTTARVVGEHSIQSSLIRIPAKPSRGWGVVLPMKGQPIKINGMNPRDVAHNATQLFKINGLHVDKTTLWFNLNIQWLQKTPEKYHLVPLSRLLELSAPQEVINDDPHAVAHIPLSSWSGNFKAFLDIYTSADTYQWEVFLGFLNQYQKLLNPSENALLGDSNSYVRFTLALDRIKRNPAYTSEKARVWLNEIQF